MQELEAVSFFLQEIQGTSRLVYTAKEKAYYSDLKQRVEHLVLEGEVALGLRRALLYKLDQLEDQIFGYEGHIAEASLYLAEVNAVEKQLLKQAFMHIRQLEAEVQQLVSLLF